jgi:hypothetical protein
MNRKLKIVIVLSASVILVYGLIQLGQDLANQNFNWTTENVFKICLDYYNIYWTLFMDI